MRTSAAAVPLQQQQQQLCLPVKRHRSPVPGDSCRKSLAAAERISDDDEPLVAPNATAALAAAAAAAAECCDCGESETSGFGDEEEADALDIDDGGISADDVEMTALVGVPCSRGIICRSCFR
jgi:hypothetical protein